MPDDASVQFPEDRPIIEGPSTINELASHFGLVVDVFGAILLIGL
jgi:hypothetical protein